MTARAACPKARQMPSSTTCHSTCSGGGSNQRRIAPAQVPLLSLTARGVHPHSRRHMCPTATTADIILTRHRKLAIAIRRRASPQVICSAIHGPCCSPSRHGESADRVPLEAREDQAVASQLKKARARHECPSSPNSPPLNAALSPPGFRRQSKT